MKDIYVYFSNPDYFRDFRDDPDFVHTNEYGIIESANCSQIECGKIKLNNGVNIRVLFDTGKNQKCPWCDCEAIIVKYNEIGKYDCNFLKLYAECQKCLARGPTLHVNAPLDNSGLLDEFIHLVLYRWANRIPKSVTPPPDTLTKAKE